MGSVGNSNHCLWLLSLVRFRGTLVLMLWSFHCFEGDSLEQESQKGGHFLMWVQGGARGGGGAKERGPRGRGTFCGLEFLPQINNIIIWGRGQEGG